MKQRFERWAVLVLVAVALIVIPAKANQIIFEEDFSGHEVGSVINSANGWTQLFQTPAVLIGDGDPDLDGNFGDGTDRTGITPDAAHYNPAGIGAGGMNPDLEYRFSFTWKMGPNTHGGSLGFHNSGSATGGKPNITALASFDDGPRMHFKGGDDELAGFTIPAPGEIAEVELVINSVDNYAIVNGFEGLHKNTVPGLMEDIDGIFWWHPAEFDARDGGLVDDIVVYIAEMDPSLPGDANGDGLVNVADLGIVGANFNQTGTTVEQGNFNDDDRTDIADLGILGANWTAAALASPIPEPTSMLIVIAAAAGAGVRRRSR